MPVEPSLARPFDKSSIPVVIVDADDRVVGMNPAAEALCGALEEDVRGRSLSAFVELTYLEGTAAADVTHALDERGLWQGPMVQTAGDGRTHFFDTTILRIPDPASGRDLTYSFLAPAADAGLRNAALDDAHLRESLPAAQKMELLAQLSPGVAHELNNPLSAIIAFSQLMKRDDRLPPDVQRDADLLMAEADRTQRIVQNLLDFVRRRAPARRPASIIDLIERAIELHAYGLGMGRIDVRRVFADGLPPVEVDASEIQQLLLNLMSNAIQAIKGSTRSGAITIEAALVQDGAGAPGTGFMRVTVTDDGPGVPEAIRGRLFEPFFTTRKAGEGMGLGLSVSHGIVASHGGHLWFEPASRGGSRFLFELPATWPATAGTFADADHANAQPKRRGGGAILAVDDEPFVRQMLASALEQAGHEVTVASSGQEALDELRTLTFDVLLADHHMSGMDGVELYELAAEIRPELRERTVIMSGDALEPALRAFASSHCLRLLAKPFDLNQLLRLVDEILDLD